MILENLNCRSYFYLVNGLIFLLLFAILVIYSYHQNLKKARYLSFHDQLTGLYNRNFFEVEVKRLDNRRNLPLSIVIVDINSLKYINDNFGHKVGDQVLIKMGQILKKSCRKGDILSRWGGDEFVLLLPGTDKQSAEKVVNRINNNIKNTDIINFNAALGVATKVSINQDIDEVFKKADFNLYNNKKKIKDSLSRDSKILPEF